jgi:hypothetical protein
MKVLERLRYSGLKVTQIIDATRRFILPRLDYTMMNSIISITELGKLDEFIRNMFNEMIGGPALSKDLFYTSTKNGGLGLRQLTERYQACKYNTIAHFMQRDEGTKEFIKWQFREEERKRSVKKSNDSLFFVWDEVGVRKNKGRSHSMISELYYAACKARIGIKFDEDTEQMIIWKEEGEKEVKYCKKGETAQEVGKIFEARHYENLLKQKCRGRSFCTLGNSKVSNFFISNPKAPNADSLMRFTIRARNDTLWTPARKAMIFKNEGFDTRCSCGNHRFCDLLHILNNCPYNMKEMTQRHNMIQEVLVEAIRKHRKVQEDEILTNKTISNGRFTKDLGMPTINLSEDKQRPDIHFWADISQEEDKY